jgi:hypothetical protein
MYTIDIRPRARRSLSQLDPAIRKAVAQTIDALATDPRPTGAALSRGTDHTSVSVRATIRSSMPLTTRHVSSPSPLLATAARSTAGWSCSTVSMPPVGTSDSSSCAGRAGRTARLWRAWAPPCRGVFCLGGRGCGPAVAPGRARLRVCGPVAIWGDRLAQQWPDDRGDSRRRPGLRLFAACRNTTAMADGAAWKSVP